MKKRKIIFFVLVLCLMVMAAIMWYWYQKPRASIAGVQPAYSLTASDLFQAFQVDETKANQQFLEKVIRVTGTVGEVQVTDTTISILLASGDTGGINCSVRKGPGVEDLVPAKGAAVTVKGRCIGFLMDVNLVDAVIENK
jgi:hypothetical protein